jgi:hypothetical protein
MRRPFSRPCGTFPSDASTPALKRRAIIGLSRWDWNGFRERNIPVPGLTPGKTYDFRLQFYRGSTGQSDWSDVVSHMVT